MKGGVILFRGTGADARRYLESDRSRADEYYLHGGTVLASIAVVDRTGETVFEGGLSPEDYASWVDWVNPFTGESMGTPRAAGEGKKTSPRFAEMVVNTPKSLSVAAALYDDVSQALDQAQADAVAQIRSFLGSHSVTRVGPRGRQEVVPAEQIETVAVVHKTSRLGDPHRHVHFQVGCRIWAAGRWRGLDTAALFKQQGAIRALGAAVLAAHPHLAAVLDGHGLTLDPVSGEVRELEPFNTVMSKRASQVEKNLQTLTAEWEETHPGVPAGPVVQSRLVAKAWAFDRPAKRPTNLGTEARWRQELTDHGYTPNLPRRPLPSRPPLVADLDAERIASRALDRCGARASTWTVHTLREQVTRLVTETGVRDTPEHLRAFVERATAAGVAACLSVLPPGAPRVEHVAHLTSVAVLRAETHLRDLLTHLVHTNQLQQGPPASMPAGAMLRAGMPAAGARDGHQGGTVVQPAGTLDVQPAVPDGRPLALHGARDETVADDAVASASGAQYAARAIGVAPALGLQPISVQPAPAVTTSVGAGANTPEPAPAIASGSGYLDAAQQAAAAAIASSEGLVIVEGAAGAGKTTMLTAAVTATHVAGRQLRVLASTKKAAQVAQQELDVPADSVAKLVHEYGWRWNHDGVWTRLQSGATDPNTGTVYTGPSIEAALGSGTRLVVDEAGMLDQDTAIALLTVAKETGATVALVGDRAQLPAVGRGGVLDIACELKQDTHDLTAVHRFTDPRYAHLTRDLRTGTNPADLYHQLNNLGLVQVHTDAETATAAIAAERAHAAGVVAVTVATNEQARQLNERIRDLRVEVGPVDGEATVVGMDALPIGTGDVIQTRRNDAKLRVANRQTWTVQQVNGDGVWVIKAVPVGGGARKHQPTVFLPADYVREHVQLAYAATTYGVQGITSNTSHTLLTDNLDGAGVYVGMTRGRTANTLHIIAENADDAREQFIAALGRDRADRGLAHASQAAIAAIAPLVVDGPVAVVNTERERLAKVIADAERLAEAWAQAGQVAAERFNRYLNESAAASTALETARQRLDEAKQTALEPLLAQAHTDARTLNSSWETVVAANREARDAGRFGKKAAARAVSVADARYRHLEAELTARWGSTPVPGGSAIGWARSVVEPLVEAAPAVTAAKDAVEQAAQRVRQVGEENVAEMRSQRLPSQRTENGRPDREATAWAKIAATARRDLAHLESLPPVEGARHIEQQQHLAQQRAEQEATKQAKRDTNRELANKEWQLRQERDREHEQAMSRHLGPSLGM